MAHHKDVAIVGAGIVGLAFAWEAARRGKSVVLFERTRKAEGASIRNFGMIWPIGQTPGEAYARALRSRSRWLELKEKAGLWVSECGSLHVVYHADEDALLREFADRANITGYQCEYIAAEKVVRRFPAVNPAGLEGALYSPTELAVNPPEAIARLPKFLAEAYGVEFRPNTAIVGVDMPQLRTASGETWQAEKVFICSGSDFETLFPAVYAKAGLRRCKLQMMKTAPQPGGWRLGTHLAGGLTLCHYSAFADCRGLAAVKARIAATMPDYVRYGIHVMASQNDKGEVIIGDSHEYDSDISPFDRSEIDDMILSYLWKMLKLPDPAIAARWQGIYAKHPEKLFLTEEPQPGCIIAAATGGAGMTLSFGLAEDWWNSKAGAL